MLPDRATDRRIVALNPWWVTGTADTDPHLRALRDARFAWDPPVLHEIDLAPGSIHTLRGPRQVGKTTTAKRIVETLLRRGERRVFFYSFDLESDAAAVPAIIERSRELAGAGEGPWYVLLDEVTAIPEWQRGLKFAWDQGLIRGDFVLCTGSSARRMGTEQLPGRRGRGRDFLLFPASFHDFCTNVRGIDLPEAPLPLTAWTGPEGAALARRLYLQLPALSDALDDYLRVGGFPAALDDYLAAGEVGAATISTVWAMIANEMRAARLDPAAALKLVDRVSSSLGSALSWQAAATAMDVGSHHTARGYVQALAESFALLVVYHWSVGGGFEPRKQRKVYFVDPLFARIPSAALGMTERAPPDGMLEGVVATTLFRSAGDQLVQAEPTLGALGYWRSSEGREIDFVVDIGEEAEGPSRRLPVEVKGDARRAIQGAVASIHRTFGRGIVVSRTTLERRGDVLVVPAPVFLAGIDERAERRLALL